MGKRIHFKFCKNDNKNITIFSIGLNNIIFLQLWIKYLNYINVINIMNNIGIAKFHRKTYWHGTYTGHHSDTNVNQGYKENKKVSMV